MVTLHIIRQSFRLLGRRDRWILGLITLAQMATGGLDLIGVLLIGLVGVISVSTLSGTALPSSVQRVVDAFDLQNLDSVTLAAWVIGAAGAALVLKSALTAWLSRRSLQFLAHRQADLSAQLTQELLSRPLLEIQARASQDVAFSLTIGTQTATVGILGAATTALSDLALLLVLGIGLSVVDLNVTLFALAFFGAVGWSLHKALSGWATRMGQESTDVNIATYSAIQEAIQSYREVMVAHRRQLYVNRIKDLRWKSAELSANAQLVTLIPKYAFETALVVGALGLAVSQAITKDASAAVGIVAVFLAAGSRIMPALLRLQVASLNIRQSEAPAARAIALLDDMGLGSEASGPPLSAELLVQAMASGYPGFTPSLEVQRACLTYPGSSTPALVDVSVSVVPGTSLAIVGSTGAGKSTLADIILGVVNPDTGDARIGGIRSAEALARWPGGIAYVPQEVALINGTIRDNVSLGLPKELVDDDRVWSALERAHVATFLREQREGLDTWIGENGMRLSGGQRQRLGMARALYTRPRFLVLDEATSALDAETEEAITQTLRDLEGDVTTVTIAHRLATIRHADQVLYLEHGAMAGLGTFEEVRTQSSSFDRQAGLLGL